MKFSEKIKQFRMQNNMTQQELADKLFVSRSAVAKWEQDRGMPGVELLEKLSEILHISIDELIGEKEYRVMTLESNQKVKKHDRYNKVIICIGTVFFAAIVLLFVLFFNIKKDEKKFYNYDIYGIAEAKEESVDVLCEDHRYGLFAGQQTFSITREDFKEIDIFDKFGKRIENEELRTGYRLRLEISSSDAESMKNIKIQRIDIIDDYVEGDYYAYGFFITTEKYDGEEAPIHLPSFGFDSFPDIAYTENGINYGLSFRYPWYLEKTYSQSWSSDIIDRIGSEDIAFSRFNDMVAIAKERTFTIEVSDRVETVYVYAVDNSAKRYSFVKEVTAKDALAEIPNGALFNDSYQDDYREAYKMNVTYRIQILFEQAISYVSISEYDRNHEMVYSTTYDNYEDLMSSLKTMTEEGVRYVRARYHLENGNSFNIQSYAIGDYMEITLENKYGFMLTKRARLY